jgi:hypothetical protein
LVDFETHNQFRIVEFNSFSTSSCLLQPLQHATQATNTDPRLQWFHLGQLVEMFHKFWHTHMFTQERYLFMLYFSGFLYMSWDCTSTQYLAKSGSKHNDQEDQHPQEDQKVQNIIIRKISILCFYLISKVLFKVRKYKTLSKSSNLLFYH